MGKHLVSKHSKVHIDDNNPGCKWGIFQVLYYHHWRHVKKMFSLTKHHETKHARYTRKEISFNHYCNVSQESEDAEAEEVSGKSKSPNKNQDLFKKEDCKCKMSSPPTGKQLHPLCQKHGLESSDKCLDCLSNFGNKADDSANQRHYFFLPESPEELVAGDGKSRHFSTNATDRFTDDQAAQSPRLSGEYDTKLINHACRQELMGANKCTADISHQMMEYNDVLEVIKSKNYMFLKILQDLDLNKKPSYCLQASNSSAKLLKSGSFPAAKSVVPDSKSISTLKHKQTEIWAFPKVEELYIASPAQDYVKPVPSSPTDDIVAGSGLKGKTHKFSSGISAGSNQQSWNQLVVHRFKIMKKKIKHAITEFKKDKDSKSNYAEAINQEISTEEQGVVKPIIGNNEDCREYVDNCQESYGTWDSNRCERKVSMMRRTASVKESLDRYTNLFEQSFGKDKKWQNSKSKSLKLTNEDKVRISRSTSMSYGRNLSLPDHIFLYEASYDSQNSLMPERISVDINMKSERLSLNAHEQVDAVEEARLDNENAESRHSNMTVSAPYDLAMVEHNEDNAEISELGCDKHLQLELSSSCEQANMETECTTDPCRDLIAQAQESVILDDEHQDHISSFMEASFAGCSSAEPGCSVDDPKTQCILSLPDSTCERTDDEVDKMQPAEKCTQLYHLLRPEFDLDGSSDFKYLKYILKCLGILADQRSGISNITEDLLSETLSKDIEAFLADEFQSSGDYIAYLHHWLLIDLLKEVLVDMRETSSTYFPMPFSFNCRARPIPKGIHVLQEAWKGISSCLSLMPELDQSLDDVVGRDLAKGTWANLQLETECMTFEIEDMIFEELLDEIVCSLGCRYS